MRGRRVTTAVTLLVLAVVLCVMAVVGFKTLTAPFTSSPTKASPSCAAQDKVVTRTLTRRAVQVSVYNAGTRSGLAGNTLDELVKSGFQAGDVGNAPGTAQVPRAVVWTTKDADPAAKLVALSLGRGTRVEVVQQTLGPGVNVLVGNKFHNLDKKAAKQIKLATPVTTCVGTG